MTDYSGRPAVYLVHPAEMEKLLKRSRTTFDLPAPLRRRLKAHAEATGLKEAEIIRRALDEHLPKLEK